MNQKDAFEHKIALILGADTVLGRSLALQFSRSGCSVVLAGEDEAAIGKVARTIYEKEGYPHEVLLHGDNHQNSLALRERRDQLGHYHFVVNAVAFEGPAAAHRERAEELNALTMELTAGRGIVRFATLWPAGAPAPRQIPEGAWHTLVTISALEGDEPGAAAPDAVKPAAAADAVVSLLRCPPGACPVSVKLAPRNLKY